MSLILAMCFFKTESDIARHFLCSPEYFSPSLHTYRMLEMAAISSPQLLLLDSFFLKNINLALHMIFNPLKIPAR